MRVILVMVPEAQDDVTIAFPDVQRGIKFERRQNPWPMDMLLLYLAMNTAAITCVNADSKFICATKTIWIGQ